MSAWLCLQNKLFHNSSAFSPDAATPLVQCLSSFMHFLLGPGFLSHNITPTLPSLLHLPARLVLQKHNTRLYNLPPPSPPVVSITPGNLKSLPCSLRFCMTLLPASQCPSCFRCLLQVPCLLWPPFCLGSTVGMSPSLGHCILSSCPPDYSSIGLSSCSSIRPLPAFRLCSEVISW